MMKKLRSLIGYIGVKYYLKKPEQLEFFESRYTDFKSIYRMILNQVFYIFHSTSLPKLTSIQFEVTNKCNLKCKMCPVNHGMKRKKGFMDFNLFKRLINENPKIEFALMSNWGEPLLHPKIFEMLNYAKKKNIRTLITTNATLLNNDEKIKKLLASGVERITISLDGFDKVYKKIRGFDYCLIEKRVLRMIELRDKLKLDTKIDINMVVMDETEDQVPRFYKRWSGVVDRIQIQPNMSFTPKKRKTRCKEFWRGNLIVLWDGTVVPCCVDYEGQMVLGNANKNKLSKIRNSLQARKFRKMHNKKNFPKVCQNCNEFETQHMSSRFE